MFLIPCGAAFCRFARFHFRRFYEKNTTGQNAQIKTC